MPISETTTTNQIDSAATKVVTLIHDYHDKGTKIWPVQPTRQDTPMPVRLKPPISRAGLRQIESLAKLRNECNTTTKLHPEIPNDSELNPLHINFKINHILQRITSLTTKEAQQRCFKAIGNIIRKACHALTNKIRDKANNSYDKNPPVLTQHYKHTRKNNPESQRPTQGNSPHKPDSKKITNESKKSHINCRLTLRAGKKKQHQNTYRTLHGHNHITRTTSTRLPHPHTQRHAQARPSINTSQKATMTDQ